MTELRNALASISSLAYDEMSILLSFSKKGIVVSDTKESNTLRVVVEESEGLKEAIQVRFTRSILNEALSPISTNRVRFKFKDANSPFIFEPVFDDDSSAENVFLLAVPAQD